MSQSFQYQVGSQILQLPLDHPLPSYQAQHPLYERFPFFLASVCKPGKWIIDVGANIGDTVTAFVQSTAGNVLAIEGHRPYFDLLDQNVRSLSNGMSSRVRIVNALVGTGQVTGSLMAFNGTATIVPGSTNEHVSLDAILEQQAIAPESVSVLKTDTDGYDADVILSGSRLLTLGSPILYFENQFDNDQQLARYETMYAEIAKMNYTLFSIFDNFGNLMLDVAPFHFLSSLNKYLKAQNVSRGTRTVYYYDVLAYREDRADVVVSMLLNYRKFILRS